MNKTPKLLVLGAGLLQSIALEKARGRNIETWVVDQDPTAPGVELADHYVAISTTDEQHVVELARRVPVDGVMTLATDMPMRSVGRCVDELGLPGPSNEATFRATDKLAMVQAFARHDVPCAEFVSTAQHDWLENAYTLFQRSDGLIVKPLDSSGSRGVSLVANYSELSAAVQYANKYSSKDRGVLIEEVLRGPEVSVELLIDQTGTPEAVAVTDKVTTGSPHFTELGHSQPSRLPVETVAAIKSCACEASKALGLKSCAGHAELIVTSVGPKMVEMGARLGGDFIGTHLVELSTGVDMVNEVISLALGMPLSNRGSIFKRGSASRFSALKEGRIVALEGIERAQMISGIIQAGGLARVGQIAHGTSNSLERGAFVIACADNADKAWDIAGRGLNQIVIRYER